ncbi:hypothetical protein GCM10018952_16740 [Streptosporangium vulgare]
MGTPDDAHAALADVFEQPVAARHLPLRHLPAFLPAPRIVAVQAGSASFQEKDRSNPLNSNVDLLRWIRPAVPVVRQFRMPRYPTTYDNRALER